MPERTCIGCRKKRSASELVRLGTSSDGSPVRWTGSGRSAYVCPEPECFALAFGKGRLARALRRSFDAKDLEALHQALVCELR